MSKPILFFCPSMEPLARAIHNLTIGRIELGSILWRRFTDTTPNLFIERVGRVRNRHVSFLASFETVDLILEQYSAAHDLMMYGPRTFKFLLPYYPTGTMERRSKPGDVATGATLATILCSLPAPLRGRTQIVIYDIHALQNVDYFRSPTVCVREETAVSTIRHHLEELYPDFVIVFPDEGSDKRNSHRFENHPHVRCLKVRDGEKREIIIREGRALIQHKACVIIDDLGRSGTTLLECASQLKKEGATEVVAALTHGVFSRGEWRRFLEQDCPVDRLLMTDSCPWTSEAVRNESHITVISLAPHLSEIILEK